MPGVGGSPSPPAPPLEVVEQVVPLVAVRVEAPRTGAVDLAEGVDGPLDEDQGDERGHDGPPSSPPEGVDAFGQRDQERGDEEDQQTAVERVPMKGGGD